MRMEVFARRAYCVSASNFSCVCVRSSFVRRPCVRALIFRPVLDRQNTDSKGICRKNCSVLGPTLPFLDHSPGSSGFEDLGSETDKRGSEDQPSEAKSAPVVFFVKLVSQLLLCVLNLNFHFGGANEAGLSPTVLFQTHPTSKRTRQTLSNYDQVKKEREMIKAHRFRWFLRKILF